MPQKQHEGAGCNTAFNSSKIKSYFSRSESNRKVLCICILVVKVEEAKLQNYLPRLFEIYRAEPIAEHICSFGCLDLPGCVNNTFTVLRMKAAGESLFANCSQEHRRMQKTEAKSALVSEGHGPSTLSWETQENPRWDLRPY